MTEQVKPTTESQDQQSIAFWTFLESHPPGSIREVMEAGKIRRLHNGGDPLTQFTPTYPPIKIHCEHCDGPRTFRCETKTDDYFGPVNLFLEYTCGDCRASRKTYALRLAHSAGHTSALKFGEHPPFGPPTPNRLLKILGDESDTFKKGRRCESQNLGIAAFAYYRRVVENLKTKIFDQIIKVAKATGSSAELVTGLERAREDFQFTNAMGTLKAGIPPALLIGGHNPLILLHGALSRGIHSQSDQECLESAHDIRLVLVAMVETIGQTLKDDAELTSAVGRLSRTMK